MNLTSYESSTIKPLAITCGDPAGIGPEVIEKALCVDDMDASDICLIGPVQWAMPIAEKMGATFEAVGEEEFLMEPGTPSIASAAVAFEALDCAAAGCREGRYRGVCSGPVSKHWMQQAGFKWPGQTEFFADRWGGEPSMGFVGEKLRVVLATWHIPLKEVSGALDASCLERAVRRADMLARSMGASEPRIGVCGLNPHAGEGGIIGLEELEILDPALRALRPEFPGLSSCLPGDTVFFRQLKGEFDVIVSLYHDQGLVAVKTLEFDKAVNVTLGLPYVRTSPDHGTAFELAGKGCADSGSFASAISVARRLTATTMST